MPENIKLLYTFYQTRKYKGFSKYTLDMEKGVRMCLLYNTVSNKNIKNSLDTKVMYT